MKLTAKFNDQEISVMPSKTTEMGIGKEGIKMAIDMFTKQMYSNPIGSVVREIASNSVDSHVEAGITDPIKISLLYEESGVYVSFKDVGVGMNPHRVETIYGRYFESTKRDNNDEIGGFGVGGKSPMAYADSFFVFTIADKKDDVEHTKNVINILNDGLIEIQKERKSIGDKKDSPYMEHLVGLHGTEDEIIEHIELLTKRLKAVEAIKEERIMYHYCIFKGENAPVIQEMVFHGTTDTKGTEIKIPVRKDDIYTFAFEIKRQLYYFNNVVFEGWDDVNDFSDDYTIYKGKSFNYRGNNYESRIHVCLGDVAYPINYSSLPDVSEYDCGVPVAITLNIGDIEITPNRETLQYSKKTINVLTKKIKEVKEELVAMYFKQIENIVSLEDYLRFKNKSKAVKIGVDNVDISSLVPDNVIPKKFKYAQLNIKDNGELFKIAFDHHKIGITKRKGSYNTLSYNYLINNINNYNHKKIFYSTEKTILPNNYKRLYIKTKLEHCSSGHVVVTKRDLKNISETTRNEIYSQIGMIKYNQWENTILGWNVEEKKSKRLFNSLVKDIIKLVENSITSYDFEAPVDFVNEIKASRKRKRTTGDIKLSIRDYCAYDYACEINLSALKKFKGRIFYSSKEDEDITTPLKKAKQAHISLFNEKYVCKPYYDKNDDGSLKCGLKKNIMFIRIRKNQIHHLEKLQNAFHARDYYKIMLSRKHVDFVNYLKKRNLNNILMNLPSLLNNPDISKIDVKIDNAIKTINNEVNSISTSFSYNNFDSWYGVSMERLSTTLNIHENDKQCTSYKSKKEIEFIKNLQEKNEDVFSFINADKDTPFTDKLVMLLDLALER